MDLTWLIPVTGGGEWNSGNSWLNTGQHTTTASEAAGRWTLDTSLYLSLTLADTFSVSLPLSSEPRVSVSLNTEQQPLELFYDRSAVL